MLPWSRLAACAKLATRSGRAKNRCVFLKRRSNVSAILADLAKAQSVESNSRWLLLAHSFQNAYADAVRGLGKFRGELPFLGKQQHFGVPQSAWRIHATPRRRPRHHRSKRSSRVNSPIGARGTELHLLGFGMCKQAEKISGRGGGNFLQRNPPQFGNVFGHVLHITRLIHLAAKRCGCQIG